MELTLQITVRSLEDYLEVLHILDDSKLDGQCTVKPALESLKVIAALEAENGR